VVGADAQAHHVRVRPWVSSLGVCKVVWGFGVDLEP
jgi:hypothetical protein